MVCDGQLPWPVLLWGEAGSGKTCAALCVLDHYGGLYLDTALFCEYRAQAQHGELRYESGYPQTEKEIWGSVDRAMIVVLDELGMRSKGASDFQFETVKRVMDVREERPAIYVSNLSPADLARVYDDRIASRATAGTVMEMSGDRRRGR